MYLIFQYNDILVERIKSDFKVDLYMAENQNEAEGQTSNNRSNTEINMSDSHLQQGKRNTIHQKSNLNPNKLHRKYSVS